MSPKGIYIDLELFQPLEDYPEQDFSFESATDYDQDNHLDVDIIE